MRKFTIICCLFLLPSMIRAESAVWIDWPSFARLVSEHNAALIAAREALERARFTAEAAEAAWWPTISGAAGFSQTDTEGSAEGPVDRTSIGLDARYTLYAGGADSARIRQARAALALAEAEWADARAAIGAEARRAYARLQFACARVALAESIVERRRQNLDLVNLRFESGGEHRGSLMRVEAAALQAEADLEQARRERSVRQRELTGLAGRDDVAEWTPRDELELPRLPEEADPGPLARTTPRVRAATARLKATREALAIARGALRPELALRGAIDRSGDSWPPDRDSWSAGVTLSMPFFTGGRNIHQLAAAQADVRLAEARLDQETRAVQLELESARADLLNAIRQVVVQQAFREAAETRAEIARAQYANGLLSFQNWDQIEDERIQSQQNLLARMRDAALAEAEWDRVRGRSPLPDLP